MSNNAASSNASFAPASLPPAGDVSHLDNPRDVYYTADMAIAIACMAVINVLFLINVFVKWRLKRGIIVPEDWFCVAAWVLVNGSITSTLMRCIHGEGRPLWDITLAEYRQYQKWLYIGSAMYSPAAFCTKVTLLLLMARVFSVNTFLAKCIRIFIAVLAIAYLPVQGLKIFICRPISAYWDIEMFSPTEKNPKCFDQAVLFMCDILIAIVTDFIILVLPITLVWSMDTCWHRKIKYIVLLGAGGAATATTMLRAHYNVELMHSSNVTADIALSSITTILELSIGLSCACLPAANLLFEKAVHSFRFPSLRAGGGNHATDEGVLPGGGGGGGVGGGSARKASNATTSSHWSSIVSKITERTVNRTVRRSYDRSAWPSRRSQHRDVDVEPGPPMSPMEEMFNNPLDVPSIRSTSEERSRSSMDNDDNIYHYSSHSHHHHQHHHYYYYNDQQLRMMQIMGEDIHMDHKSQEGEQEKEEEEKKEGGGGGGGDRSGDTETISGRQTPVHLDFDVT